MPLWSSPIPRWLLSQGFTGDGGNNNITGTGEADTIDVSQGGHDTVHGADGDDTIIFGATLETQDHVHGGAGIDTITLQGDYAPAGGYFSLLPTMLDSIEKITLFPNSGATLFTYHLQLAL